MTALIPRQSPSGAVIPPVEPVIPTPLFSTFMVVGIELGSPSCLYFDPENVFNLSNGAFEPNEASEFVAYSLKCLESGRYSVVFTAAVGFPTNSGPATITSKIAVDSVEKSPPINYVRTAGNPSITTGFVTLNNIFDIEEGQDLAIPTVVTWAGTPDTAGFAAGMITIVRLGDIPTT